MLVFNHLTDKVCAYVDGAELGCRQLADGAVASLDCGPTVYVGLNHRIPGAWQPTTVMQVQSNKLQFVRQRARFEIVLSPRHNLLFFSVQTESVTPRFWGKVIFDVGIQKFKRGSDEPSFSLPKKQRPGGPELERGCQVLVSE